MSNKDAYAIGETEQERQERLLKKYFEPANYWTFEQEGGQLMTTRQIINYVKDKENDGVIHYFSEQLRELGFNGRCISQGDELRYAPKYAWIVKLKKQKRNS